MMGSLVDVDERRDKRMPTASAIRFAGSSMGGHGGRRYGRRQVAAFVLPGLETLYMVAVLRVQLATTQHLRSDRRAGGCAHGDCEQKAFVDFRHSQNPWACRVNVRRLKRRVSDDVGQ